MGWIVEAKYDDARGIARLYDGDAHIQSRPGNNLVARFPDLVESLRTVLDGHTVILEREIVVLGKDGRPDFGRLQRRLRVNRPTAVLSAAVPASYYLYLDSRRRF